MSQFCFVLNVAVNGVACKVPVRALATRDDMRRYRLADELVTGLFFWIAGGLALF